MALKMGRRMSTKIFFNGYDAPVDSQLWVSDGTALGTHTIIVPTEEQFVQFYPFDLTPYEGKIYFSAFEGGNDALYESDGTVAGTVPVLGSDGNPIDQVVLLTASGNDLFFTTLTNNSQTVSLWVSIAGATPVRIPSPNILGLEYSFTPYNGGVVFYGYSGVYFSDGHSITPLLTNPPARPDLSYGVYGPPIVPVVFGNNHLLLSSLVGYYNQLTVSNGTSLGTQQLYIPGLSAQGSQTSFAFAWGNRVVFDAVTASNHDNLFVSDGTTGGTHDLSPALASFVASVGSGIVFLGKLLLAGRDAAGNAVLLLTDGTTAGTSVLATSAAAADGFELGVNAVVAGTTVYFAGPSNSGLGLWKSDGSAAGTAALQVSSLGPYGIEPTSLASLSPAYTLYGDLNGRSAIQGTIEDDYITAYGSSNTIHGNGGSDTIFGGSGGYNQVYEGAPGDGAGGSTTVTLQGRGNTVVGGDENFSISGGTGYTGITLGNGNDTVSLGGDYNTVAVGSGNDSIDAGGGFSKVVISGASGAAPSDTITFTGQHDQLFYDVPPDPVSFTGFGTVDLTGGSGYGNFEMGSSSGTVVTDGLYNTITYELVNSFNQDYVTAGSGYDTVNMGTIQSPNLQYPLSSAFTISLGGTHNTVEGEANIATVSGGIGNGKFIFNFESNIGLPDGLPIPTDFYNVTTGGSYNSFALLVNNQNTIVAGSDHATVSIQNPTLINPGSPPPYVPPFETDVTFAGVGNSLTAVDGPVTAEGGDGGSTYVLGNGDDAIMTGGTLNFISLGSGQSTVAPGSGYDTVVLNGSNADVQLQGAADKVFLNAGASGPISGTGLDELHIFATPGIGNEVINGLLTDSRTVITLTGGAGGYTSAAQAYAALTSDGAGGSQLAIGSGTLDFAGAPLSSLSSHMFTIG